MLSYGIRAFQQHCSSKSSGQCFLVRELHEPFPANLLESGLSSILACHCRSGRVPLTPPSVWVLAGIQPTSVVVLVQRCVASSLLGFVRLRRLERLTYDSSWRVAILILSVLVEFIGGCFDHISIGRMLNCSLRQYGWSKDSPRSPLLGKLAIPLAQTTLLSASPVATAWVRKVERPRWPPRKLHD